MRNTLFYGDNLEVLRDHVGDATVDLVYLDPPFNSNRDYNVLFKEQSGADSPAQIKAFGDTWKWANAAPDWARFADVCPSPRVQDLMDGFLRMLGHNDVSAYLVMMAPRLWHLHRVLKPTGSLYLHCDPTASHYLKILLDAIFGPRCYRSEITWLRSRNPKGSQHKAKKYSPDTDIILYYAKSEATELHYDRIKTTINAAGLAVKYDREDDYGPFTDGPILRSPSMGDRPNLVYEYNGFMPGSFGWRVVIDKLREIDAVGNLGWTSKGQPYRKLRPSADTGNPIGNCWMDIPPINPQALEKLGYPTQKPLALLERIITASSNPDDVVLDPFCGCGTAIVAAQMLGRRWLGIDVTPIATTLIIDRLAQMDCRDTRIARPGDADYVRAFDVTGLPTDIDGARELFARNPKDFEMWAVGLIPMTPQDKKGADGGIDGMRDYPVGNKKPLRAVAQVKGGHVGAPQVQQLRGAMERFGAQVGAFVCLEKPTRNMEHEAALAGFHRLPLTGRDVPRIQLRTVGDLLDGRVFDLPQTLAPTQVVGVSRGALRQGELEI